MYKIIDFLDKDEDLISKRKELRENMRALKEATYNDDQNCKVVEKELEDYEVVKTIGLGSYAVVKLVEHKETKEQFAIKFYNRIQMLDFIKMKNYQSEVANMEELDHPNIIKLYKAVEGKRKFLMFMEYIGCSTLADILKDHTNKMLAEAHSKVIFK